MSIDSSLITADEYSAMSFDKPTELVRGEIIEMTNPGGRHGSICFKIAFLLGVWNQNTSKYVITTNDSGILTHQEPDSVRGPDVLVIKRDRLPGGKIPVKHFTVAPDVAIEVRSPSDRWSELVAKVGEFLLAGVGEVWVIDPDHQRVHLFQDQDEPTILNVDDTLSSSRLLGFSYTVGELFLGVET